MIKIECNIHALILKISIAVSHKSN